MSIEEQMGQVLYSSWCMALWANLCGHDESFSDFVDAAFDAFAGVFEAGGSAIGGLLEAVGEFELFGYSFGFIWSHLAM